MEEGAYPGVSARLYLANLRLDHSDLSRSWYVKCSQPTPPERQHPLLFYPCAPKGCRHLHYSFRGCPRHGEGSVDLRDVQRLRHHSRGHLRRKEEFVDLGDTQRLGQR